MHSFLLAAKTLVEAARRANRTQLPPDQLTRLYRLYDTIVAEGVAENPPGAVVRTGKRGRVKQSKARNLLERFDRRRADILRFVHDFNVPFDNNLAERDIRMMKVQQKVSGCFRSPLGAVQFCRLRSYTATIRKQGLSVWQAIGSLFAGNLFMPELVPV